MNQPTGERAAPFFAAIHSDGRTDHEGVGLMRPGPRYRRLGPGRTRWRLRPLARAGRRVHAESRPVRHVPCYYCVGANTLRVSPSIPRLLADGAPVTLDDEALAVFFRLGFFLDDRTPFRAIRAVPPGARLTWKEGQFTLATRGRVLQREAVLKRSAAIDG